MNLTLAGGVRAHMASTSAFGKPQAPPYPQQSNFPSTSSKPHDDLFRNNNWRDVWAAILYFLSVAAFIGIAWINISYLGQFLSVGFQDDTKDFMMALILSQTATVFLSLIISAVQLVLMNKFPKGVIRVSWFGTTGLIAALGLYEIITGQVLAGIMSFLFAGLNLFLFYLWRKHIPFTASLLQWTTRTMGEFPAMFVANLGIMILLCFVLVASLTTLAGARLMQINDKMSPEYTKGTSIYVAFWLFWSTEIFQNLSRVVSAGVFACRYFLGKESPLAPNPTSESFKRATTYSFGSICFGSLLVSIITFLRFLLNTSDDRNNLGPFSWIASYRLLRIF